MLVEKNEVKCLFAMCKWGEGVFYILPLFIFLECKAKNWKIDDRVYLLYTSNSRKS